MKAFVIYLPDRPHSVESSASMIQALKGYSIDAELIEGTPGDRAVEMATKSKKTLFHRKIR